MNAAQHLHQVIKRKIPQAHIRLHPPKAARGVWALDIDFNEIKLAVEWSEETGFAIGTVCQDNYGERPDESFQDIALAAERIINILRSGEKTNPPVGILLLRLREQAGLTQQQLAEKLNIKQATISGAERRSDMQVSTLRKFAAALGARAEIKLVSLNAQSVSTICDCIEVKNQDRDALSSAPFTSLEKNGVLDWATQAALQIRDRRSVFEFPE